MTVSGLSIHNGQLARTTNEQTGSLKIEDAARQFEALMFEQILKSMREAGGGAGWLGGGEDQAGQTMTDLAEQQFAAALASQGALGIARTVTSALEKPAGASGSPRAGQRLESIQNPGSGLGSH